MLTTFIAMTGIASAEPADGVVVFSCCNGRQAVVPEWPVGDMLNAYTYVRSPPQTAHSISSTIRPAALPEKASFIAVTYSAIG